MRSFRSRLDLLQQLLEIPEAFAPECAVDFEPIDHRREAAQVDPVAHITSVAALLHEACLAQRLQVLRNRGLGDAQALCEGRDRKLGTLRDALENPAARRVGEGLHHGGDAAAPLRRSCGRRMNAE
jgi:hypothetical protein